MQAESTHKSSHSFEVPHDYDYEKSSEDNYCSADAPFVGKYAHIRRQLDYSFHKHYSIERQHLHDKLIDRFLKTVVHDRKRNVECEVPLENWIVFTAGPMGAGKGHTMQWLYKHDLFPLDAFVNVDPDAIRHLLPETAQYNHRDDNTAGYLTQKEVGYISEVLSYDSLLKGKNVLVDGSLRNAHWYLEYFRNLREKFPVIKIGILHVTARPETVLLRARNRAAVTGRFVPEETILESMRTIPESLAVLSRHAEFVATFLNEDEDPEPRLGQCCMQERLCDVSVSEELEGSQSMRPLWCIQELDENEEQCGHDGAHSSFIRDRNNDAADMETLRSCSMCYETFHRQNSSSLKIQQTVDANGEMNASEGSTMVALGGPNTSASNGSTKPHTKHHVYKLTELAPTRVCLLDSWKDLFSRVWEMKCAIPTVPATPAGVTVPVTQGGGSSPRSSPRSSGFVGSLRTTVHTSASTSNIVGSGSSALASSPRLSESSGTGTCIRANAGAGAAYEGNGLDATSTSRGVGSTCGGSGDSVGKHTATRVVTLESNTCEVEPGVVWQDGTHMKCDVPVANGKNHFSVKEPAQVECENDCTATAHMSSDEPIWGTQNTCSGHSCSEHMSSENPSKKTRILVD